MSVATEHCVFLVENYIRREKFLTDVFVNLSSSVQTSSTNKRNNEKIMNKK
jgi:hypothetical protein